MVAEYHPPRVSVDEYLAAERASAERHEYIDGYVRLMSGGTIDHDALSVNVIRALADRLESSPCRVHSSNLKVRLSPTRYVYPDATVTCDERDRGRGDELHFPRLIVEVLSPGTEAYDRGDKFSYYRACPSLQEYVLVNARQPAVEVYRRAGDFWTLHTFGPEDEVEMSNLRLRCPLASFYRGVNVSNATPDA